MSHTNKRYRSEEISPDDVFLQLFDQYIWFIYLVYLFNTALFSKNFNDGDTPLGEEEMSSKGGFSPNPLNKIYNLCYTLCNIL